MSAGATAGKTNMSNNAAGLSLTAYGMQIPRPSLTPTRTRRVTQRIGMMRI
jgi:hypothetical protein